MKTIESVLEKAEMMARGGQVNRTMDTSAMSEAGQQAFAAVNNYGVSGSVAAAGYLKEQWFQFSNAADRTNGAEADSLNGAALRVAQAYEALTGKEL